MSPRLPWIARRPGSDDDPVQRRETIARQLREAADQTRTARTLWATRPPVLVVAGATIDGRSIANATAEVDLLSPDELAQAAERAGIDLVTASAATGPTNIEEAMALQGFVSALRGAAGENHAIAAIADGSLPTPSGTGQAQLVAHAHPGVDIVFTDPAGRVIDTANVKIASNAEIVLRHFERYPDVRIVYTTSDTAQRLERAGWMVVDPTGTIPTDGPVIVDLGHETLMFDDQIRDGLAGVVVDATTPLWAFVPWFGFGAVAVRAMRRLAVGRAGAEVAGRALDDTYVAALGSAAAQGGTMITGSTAAALPFALVGAWTAQATLSVRRSWTAASKREQRLRVELLRLRDGLQ